MEMAAKELLWEVSRLTELQSVHVSLKESFKGAMITGISTLAGGLFLGPIGLAIGGTVGGCSAAFMARNKFISITDVILYELTPQQQCDLADAIRKCLNSVNIQDAVQFAINVAQNPSVATTVAMTVITFLNSQQGMKIVD
ncbi:protein C19orf12 homolog [Neodiprion fabricii]|uniref:protein C19orf12 homolog n=1 Tax=Neodiprion fabricii TaxID=2872261 RepID=UPI001ED9447D|nr:protein C19orf12 homolog [Neodiprion fabricii]XP_046422525.1 protein C19orf12 homolog [Neodiprion fabricii]XP_046422526.1 protein C19orf12 homolog [Neodiprion fabricii]